MAEPRRKQTPRRGARGARGARGERGERGEPGVTPETIDRLATVLERIQRDLEVQFTRIAELQAELDLIRGRSTNSGRRSNGRSSEERA